MFQKPKKEATVPVYVRSLTKKNHKFVKQIAKAYDKTVSDVINKALDQERSKYARRKISSKTNA